MYAKTAGLLALATGATATIKGWNYGNMFSDDSAKVQSDFESEFTTAQGLVGATDFTSARLYTMIQAYTTSDPIQAIPAAIKTNTGLLLTLWASGDTFSNELTALKSAISTYGSDLGSIVQGISVGSEDLYRISPTGIENDSGVGQSPDTLVDYIKQVRSAISGTALSAAPVGHVDTWTAWVNSSNDAVIDNCDWIGVDSYPYFQNTMANSIDDAASLMSSAISETKGAVGSKPIWVTETGWPVSGKTENLAVPSTANAKTYWDNVGCDMLFGVYNTWWYTLQDAEPTTPNPSFGVIGSTLTTTPLYDLSCSNKTTSSSSTSSATGTATSSAGGSSTTLTTVQATSTSTGSSGSSGSGESSGTGSGSSGSSSESSGSSSSGSSSSGSSSGSSGSSGSSTGASSTGSTGSGSNSTVTTGNPTSVSSGSASSSGASSGSSSVTTSGASTTMKSGAYGAAFLAIMAAIFAL